MLDGAKHTVLLFTKCLYLSSAMKRLHQSIIYIYIYRYRYIDIDIYR